jgi:hypothetical protein
VFWSNDLGRRNRIGLPLGYQDVGPWSMPFSDPTINRLLREVPELGKPEPVLFEIFRFVARIPK